MARNIEPDVQDCVDAIKKNLLPNGLADAFLGLTTRGFSKSTFVP